MTLETVSELQAEIHERAVAAGWWEGERNIGELCQLLNCEVSEAFEEYRNGHAVDEVYFNADKPTKPEGFPVELADVFIRLLDMAGGLGIDMAEVVALKMEYNLTRPYRHGGKLA